MEWELESSKSTSWALKEQVLYEAKRDYVVGAIILPYTN